MPKLQDILLIRDIGIEYPQSPKVVEMASILLLNFGDSSGVDLLRKNKDYFVKFDDIDQFIKELSVSKIAVEYYQRLHLKDIDLQENVDQWVHYLNDIIDTVMKPIDIWADIIRISALYTNRYDGYLNALYRRVSYPVKIFIKHFISEVQRKTNYLEEEDFIVNETLKRKCQNGIQSSRYLERHDLSFASFQNYLKTTNETIMLLHRTITNNAVTLDRPMTVYRGLGFNMDLEFNTKMIGLNSTSYSLETAHAYALESIGHQKITLIINLPPGCRIFPTALCSYWEGEREIIIVSQGHLKLRDCIYSAVFPDDLLVIQRMCECDFVVTDNAPTLDQHLVFDLKESDFLSLIQDQKD